MIVTVEADSTPPRVKIETDASRVIRVIDGDRVEVRGPVVDGVVYDYEVPQEVPVSYDNGSEQSPLVQMPDCGPWLVPLSDVSSSVRLALRNHDGWSSPASVSLAEVPGGDTIAVTFTRKSRRGSLEVLTRTRDERVALEDLLDKGSVLFLSTPEDLGIGPAYLAVGDTSWSRFGRSRLEQQRSVVLPYTEVGRPAYVADDALTWADLPSTWGALASTWAGLVRG